MAPGHELGPFGRIVVEGVTFSYPGSERLALRDVSLHIELGEVVALFARIGELCADRSVLLISHRFSTLRSADRICVLHEGGVVESGTHEELLTAGGTYAELFTLQAPPYQWRR